LSLLVIIYKKRILTKGKVYSVLGLFFRGNLFFRGFINNPSQEDSFVIKKRKKLFYNR